MTGRPTKYNKEVQEQAEAYLNGGYIERGDGVPSVVGLARYLGVTRSTLFGDRLGKKSRMCGKIVIQATGFSGWAPATVCTI